MDTITLSHKFENAGFNAKQSEALAQSFDEYNKEVATNGDLKINRNLIYLVAAGLGAMSLYTITLIHSTIR